LTNQPASLTNLQRFVSDAGYGSRISGYAGKFCCFLAGGALLATPSADRLKRRSTAIDENPTK